MLKLYSDPGSGNCYKVRLLLTQLRVPFSVVDVNVLERPKGIGKVPFVEFPNGERLPESNAILFHFARGTNLWPRTHFEQTRVLEWMFFEQNSHEPNIAVARFQAVYLKRAPDAEKVEKGYAALTMMERRLERVDFLAADRYTIADIALYAYTHVADEAGFELGRFPSIAEWIGRVASIPGHVPMKEA